MNANAAITSEVTVTVGVDGRMTLFFPDASPPRVHSLQPSEISGFDISKNGKAWALKCRHNGGGEEEVASYDERKKAEAALCVLANAMTGSVSRSGGGMMGANEGGRFGGGLRFIAMVIAILCLVVMAVTNILMYRHSSYYFELTKAGEAQEAEQQAASVSGTSNGIQEVPEEFAERIRQILAEETAAAMNADQTNTNIITPPQPGTAPREDIQRDSFGFSRNTASPTTGEP